MNAVASDGRGVLAPQDISGNGRPMFQKTLTPVAIRDDHGLVVKPVRLSERFTNVRKTKLEGLQSEPIAWHGITIYEEELVKPVRRDELAGQIRPDLPPTGKRHLGRTDEWANGAIEVNLKLACDVASICHSRRDGG